MGAEALKIKIIAIFMGSSEMSNLFQNKCWQSKGDSL